jgi:Zn-dependent oligopeptidase
MLYLLNTLFRENSSFIMHSATLDFQFNPNPSLDDFRQLCNEQLNRTQALLEILERPVDSDKAEQYIAMLDELDLVGRNAFDLQGRTWQKFHPDRDIREESVIANNAYTAILGAVLSSSAIADNICKLEKAKLDIGGLSARLLMSWKEDLVREGAFLDPQTKEQVRNLTSEIKRKVNEFTGNIWNDTTQISFDLSELKGLPETYFSDRQNHCTNGKMNVSRRKADIDPILSFCEVQTTREKAYRHLHNTASPVNKAVLQALLFARKKKAQLLGYDSWARFETERTMVKSPEQVRVFLDDLREGLEKPAALELARMKALAADEGVENFQLWDLAYGQNLLKKDALPHYNVREATQYFPADRAVTSLMRTIASLLQVKFKHVEDVTAWHHRVAVYHVYDVTTSSESLMGRVFLDLYARSGKNEGIGGATTVRKSIEGKQLGEMIVSANIVEAPQACMSFEEAKMFFGSIGHCVHVLLARQRFARMAGLDSVEADFSGVSGQLLHSWFCDPRVFDFVVNETGEPMPAKVLADMVTAGDIGKATARMESLVAAEMSVS